MRSKNKNINTKNYNSARDQLYGLLQKVWNELERSFETKFHSEMSMNVSDAKVTDENHFLSRTQHDDQSKQQDHMLLEGRPVRILGGTSTEEFGTPVQCETQWWFDPR